MVVPPQENKHIKQKRSNALFLQYLRHPRAGGDDSGMLLLILDCSQTTFPYLIEWALRPGVERPLCVIGLKGGLIERCLREEFVREKFLFATEDLFPLPICCLFKGAFFSLFSECASKTLNFAKLSVVNRTIEAIKNKLIFFKFIFYSRYFY